MKKDKKSRIYNLLDLIIGVLIYSLVLLTFSLIFKNTIYIDNSYFGLWSVLASIIMLV